MKRKTVKLRLFLRAASHKRKIAFFLLCIFLAETFAPSAAFALTGGPSQPEVQSFEPIGTSDMVDLFSGDFNYNIPLLDMDGYPINIGYHSGITMDQEATWVGLGWNINPGVINRAMRGVPDDYKGDEIKKELNIRPNRTYGVNAGYSLEIFGVEAGGTGGSLSFGLGIKYNNYNGIGLEQSLSVPISAGSNSYGSYSAGLGISSSSDEGLSIQPEVSLDKKQETEDTKTGATTKSLGLKIGSSFNSRAGLTQLTVSPYNKTVTTIDNDDGSESIDKKNTGVSPMKSSDFNFGMPTFTPQVTNPMLNFSLSGDFKLGGQLFGIAGEVSVGGYFSTQQLYQKEINNPAYGYMYSEKGQNNDDAILDFNREKDGSFSTNTPALYQTNFTYDMYSVSGQGVGGSYRPFRNEMGYVFDAHEYSFSNANGFGAEIGIGNAVHNGFNLSITYSGTNSGKWEKRNKAIDKLNFKAKQEGSLLENVNFAEANEKVVDADPAFFDNYGGYEAQRFILNKRIPFNHGLEDKLKGSNGTRNLPSTNYKTQRNKRNQLINNLTYQDLTDGLGIENYPSNTHAEPHHIGEITTYTNDGTRYVYGIGAYNHTQKEVTFAAGEGLYGNTHPGIQADVVNGLAEYLPGTDNSKDNDRGLDNYFSRTTTPGYAHSYLLTSVLSADYIDSDNQKGPSIGDLGNYTKFNYAKNPDAFKWRTPVGENLASYNEGLKSLSTDEKASYVYGEKDVWYMQSIESKNYIAIFHLTDREDGLGVENENGKINTTSNKLKKLDKISLYVLSEYYSDIATHQVNLAAVPIKEVHFTYDYSLSGNVPNSMQSGKLTLKEIYFTYQNSQKARLSPYKFDYSNINPAYDMKKFDRWGNYKEGTKSLAFMDPASTAEFPYSEQDPTIANQNCDAWTLTEISLPSGGKINVDYESDDYAWVQNKRAMQMFKISGTIDSDIKSNEDEIIISEPCSQNNKLYFKVDPLISTDEYFKGVKDLYFRCLVNMDGRYESNGIPGLTTASYDYVSGYAEIEDYSENSELVTSGGSTYAWVKLKGEKLNDNAPNFQLPITQCPISTGDVYSPITKAAIQFGRLYLPKYVWGTPGINENSSFGSQLLNAMIGSNFIKNLKDAVLGPNLALYAKGIGRNIVSNKSFIRLNNPNKHKLGGGCRVKKIVLSDEWETMTSTGSSLPTSSYGQEYNYNLPDGSSSGVASYEPQMGGDENPWREPVHYGDKKFLAPDDRFYHEKPYGEMFFPSPSVGYSMVTVKNLTGTNVTRHGSGKVVHEFYTAKEFPTLVQMTDLEIDRDKFNPFGIGALLKLKSKDHIAASQGFKIETNDMHGKPKSQKVYQQGASDPITSVEYKYKCVPYAFESGTTSTETFNNTFRLSNDADVVYPNGNTGTARLGVFYDMVADMRQSRSETTNAAIPFNGDGFLAAILPIYIALIIPGFGKEVVQFRGASTTKVIQRFGLLETTTAKDLGSVVSTDNLAYDAETGEVLLTQTTTDFNDKIYSLTYPAHWYYDGMGPAYKNIGFEKDLTVANGSANVPNALLVYSEGDELALENTSSGLVTKYWVVGVSTGLITIKDKLGVSPINGTYPSKIIRSGRRNMQMAKISSITTLSNPLLQFKNNVFQNVLQASAIEFSDGWKTKCDCFADEAAVNNPSSNPYVLGTKGNWKPKRSWLHLSGRAQSYDNKNTNIRKDGAFTSYSPYYANQNGKWIMDERNWTYTSEVTEFNPFGQELENKDALGRYSAATFGYKQTMATAVAANSQYKELGFDNFEDYDFSPCADNHFKFPFITSVSPITNNQSHSGRKSIKATPTEPVIMTKSLVPCAEVGCNITLTKTPRDGQPTTVIASGGTGPYTFDWNAVQGDPSVDLINNGISLSGASQIIVTVIDAKGCKVIQTINN